MTDHRPKKPPSTTAPPPQTPPPKRGRKASVEDAKDKRIAIRLTLSDHDQIDAAARSAGLTVGAYMRKVALGTSGKRAKRRPTHMHDGLARVLAEAGKIGSNVNQVAKWCNQVRLENTGKITPEIATLRAMQREITTVRTLLMEALGYDN